MTGSDRRRAVACAIAALVLAGCANEAARFPVRLENGCDHPVGLYVDGHWVGTYPAASSIEFEFAGAVDPPAAVELHAPSGRVLVSLSLDEDELAGVVARTRFVGVDRDLDCGRLTLGIGVPV